MRTMDVTTGEYRRLSSIITALAGDAAHMRVLLIPGEPHSKERARHARRGRFIKTYQPATDAEAEARTASYLKGAISQPYTGNVALAAIFYRSTRREIDYDNLLKHVNDAANGVIWRDDSLSTAGAGVIELDPARPRTLLALAPHTSTMLRGANATIACQACGIDFPLAGAKRFCTIACAGRARSKGFVPFSAGRAA